MPQVLNLNNEVVKMRKEVKKVRVLTIRKLTRQIAKLKGKKGTKDAVLKNQRRAQRLLEEIHAMKPADIALEMDCVSGTTGYRMACWAKWQEIKLDQVTKSALGKEIDFGIICKKPNSTARDRAIARLTSHPLLKTKIANIKAAVKDFKNARQKPDRASSSTEQQLEEQLNKHPEETQHSVSSETVKPAESQDKTKAIEKAQTNKGKKRILKSGIEKMADNMKKCPSYTSAVPDTENDKLIHQIGDANHSQEKIYLNDIVNKTVGDSDEDVDKSEGSRKEECFDDSTEERFCNQSSGTDESTNIDDFFIGKVKRMKKRRGANASQPMKQKIKTRPLKKTKNPQRDTVLDPNLKGSIQRPSPKSPGTLYYHVMSDTHEPIILKRNISGHYIRNRTIFEKNPPQKRMSKSSAVKHTIGRNPPQQPLHPSWEARRKMREQTSQITAFQGKKTKFED